MTADSFLEKASYAMRTKFLLSLVPVFGLLAGCVDTSTNNQLDATIKPIDVEVGKPAPDFYLPDQNNRTVRLSDFKGKVVYLDFWASWCDPCVKLLPSLKELWNDYRDGDFVMVGISFDSNQQVWKKYIADEQLDWVQTFDDGQSVGGAARIYKVQAIPQSFLVDKEGVVSAINIHGDQLRDSVESLVNR